MTILQLLWQYYPGSYGCAFDRLAYSLCGKNSTYPTLRLLEKLAEKNL